MPKSKRNREVTLSKVKKKPRTWKEGLISQVRELVDRYPSLYVFQYWNMRNDKFKELRETHLSTSRMRISDSGTSCNTSSDCIQNLTWQITFKGVLRFCMGSTKLLQVGLGKSPVDEYQDNLSQLSATLTGSVGLFFTSLPHEKAHILQASSLFGGVRAPGKMRSLHAIYATAGWLERVLDIFENFQEEDFARAGMRATENVDLDQGPLEGPAGPLPHTLEPSLRKHGLPTKLDRSVVTLLQDHRVCNEKEQLSPDQAHLLRVFGIKMAVFHMRLLSRWQKEGAVFTELAEREDQEDAEDLELEGLSGELPASMLLPPGAIV